MTKTKAKNKSKQLVDTHPEVSELFLNFFFLKILLLLRLLQAC